MRIYSQVIGIEFGIEKCAMLIKKNGKRQMIGSNKTTKSRQNQNARRNGNLQILEADPIKYTEMKEKRKIILSRRTRKQLKNKLHSRNLIKGINTWAISLVRYSGSFLKWTREELHQIDQKTRKLMTMHKALHPSDAIDIPYVSRNKGGRGHSSIQDSVDTSIQRLENNIKQRGGRLIVAT